MKFLRPSACCVLALWFLSAATVAQSMQVIGTLDPQVQGSNPDQSLCASNGFVYFNTRNGPGANGVGALCRASQASGIEVLATHQAPPWALAFVTAPIEVGGDVFLAGSGAGWPNDGFWKWHAGDPYMWPSTHVASPSWSSSGTTLRTNLVEFGGFLYVGTWGGGAFGDGTISRYNVSTGIVDEVASFHGTTGSFPVALAVVGSELYAVTVGGSPLGNGALLKLVPGVGLIPVVWFGGSIGAPPSRLRPDGSDIVFCCNVAGSGTSCGEAKVWRFSTVTQALTLEQSLGCAVGLTSDGPFLLPEGTAVMGTSSNLWLTPQGGAASFVSSIPGWTANAPGYFAQGRFVEFGGGIVRLDQSGELRLCSMAPLSAASMPLGGGCGGSSLTVTPPVFGGMTQISIASSLTGAPGWLAQSAATGPVLPSGQGCPIYIDLATYGIVAPFATNSQGIWSLTVACPPPAIWLSGVTLVLQAVLLAGGNADITNGVKITLGY